MTVIHHLPTSRCPATVQRAGSHASADGALDPAIHDTLQSAMGIVRETTGLLCNITELGLALLWSPKPPRSKRNLARSGSSPSNCATIISFAAASKRRALGRD